VLLAVLLAVLIGVAAKSLGPSDARLRPDTWVANADAWDRVWWLGVLASVAGAGLVLVYAVGTAVSRVYVARSVRHWLRYALLILIAVSLLKVGWDQVTKVDETTTDPAWKAWLASHDVLRVVLVVFVVGCLLIPVAELASVVGRSRRSR
jgi:hypothetical protein